MRGRTSASYVAVGCSLLLFLCTHLRSSGAQPLLTACHSPAQYGASHRGSTAANTSECVSPSQPASHAPADIPPPPCGSGIDFMLLSCGGAADGVTVLEDPQFQSISVDACGGATKPPDMLVLLAQHRTAFMVSLGDKTDFAFMQALPAQFRRTWFHVEDASHLTTHMVETFFLRAIHTPPGGSPSEPLLSLFTPAYKSGSKIHIPYGSLLRQTYNNWEWVIYDDSPPEHTETWRELSALSAADPRVHILRTDRNDGYIGSVKAKACGAATGQLLVELDHDDELTPDALELLRDAMVAHPDAGFFFSETVEMFEGTNRTVDYGPVFAKGQGVHYRMLLNGTWVTGANAPPHTEATLRHIVGVPNHVRAWRREAYIAVGGHTRGLPVADDYDLILRTLFQFPSVYVRHMLYIQYRQLDGSTFTFKRNALIQRLVDITSRHQDSSIHKLLVAKNMTDTGRAGTMYNFSRIQFDAAPPGAPLARYYHKPTVTAPPSQPHVTVVVPTFNNTAGLMRALQSVFAQTYANWELLVMGDKCPELDGFMEQRKQWFIEGNHTVRYYNMHEHSDSRGYAALNAAIKGLVASDWLAYLHDDAAWTPEHLSSLADVIAEHPRRSFAFASLQMNGQVIIAEEPRLCRVDASAVLHHRRLLEQYGGWKPWSEAGYANDWELFSRWGNEEGAPSLVPSVLLPDVPEAVFEKIVSTV